LRPTRTSSFVPSLRQTSICSTGWTPTPRSSRSSGEASETRGRAGDGGRRTHTSAETTLRSSSPCRMTRSLASSRRSSPSADAKVTYTLGIVLYPEFRGQGLGTSVQCLVADYLYSTTLANRVEAITGTYNHAEQRALEKAGFQREGVLRGLGFVRGQYGDGVMYSRLRSDPHP